MLKSSESVLQKFGKMVYNKYEMKISVGKTGKK